MHVSKCSVALAILAGHPAVAFVAHASRPSLRPRHAAPCAVSTAGAVSYAAPSSAASSLGWLPLAEEPSNGSTLTDTLLDIGVYGILALVVLLTGYSLIVTLQKSNEEYGGWTPRDDEEFQSAASSDPIGRPSGARYDPVTEQWTYPEQGDKKAKVGRAPAGMGAPAASSDDGNRYDRRMLKKRKKMEKARKKK